MKYYATIVNVGTEKIPILILEYIFKENEEYKGLILPFYKNILSTFTFLIHNDILYILKAQQKFLSIKVNKEFSKNISDFLFLELQLSVVDFAFSKKEQGCLFATIFKDKYPLEIIENEKPKFNIKTKDNKYLNFYKKEVITCQV